MSIAGLRSISMQDLSDSNRAYSDGEPLTLEQAIANLQGEDLGLRVYAAWWLGRLRVRDPQAIDLLIEALTDEADRTKDGGYPLRRNAARALGKLGDRRAVPASIECLSCSDYYVREAACQALGELGDPSSIPALTALLDGGVEAAQFVPGKPHLVHPYDAILEALGSLRALTERQRIEEFLSHPVERVQYAAARALYQCTEEARYAEFLIEALSHPDLKMRRAAALDLSATDYLPAARFIAETSVANSLRLIALKGLLENAFDPPDLLDVAVLPKEGEHIFLFMDSLL